jgi:hypothetical protein
VNALDALDAHIYAGGPSDGFDEEQSKVDDYADRFKRDHAEGRWGR